MLKLTTDYDVRVVPSNKWRFHRRRGVGCIGRVSSAVAHGQVLRSVVAGWFFCKVCPCEDTIRYMYILFSNSLVVLRFSFWSMTIIEQIRLTFMLWRGRWG